MRDLSLHILDVAENCLEAGASLIMISIRDSRDSNRLILTISDNGRGMTAEEIARARDPFYSTKKVRRIGMGIPMLAQAAREAQGTMNIESTPGKGTTISAQFVSDHIDRRPLGDIAETLISLLARSDRRLDVRYTHTRDTGHFIFDSRDIREELEDVPLSVPEVLNFLRKKIAQEIKKLYNVGEGNHGKKN